MNTEKSLRVVLFLCGIPIVFEDCQEESMAIDIGNKWKARGNLFNYFILPLKVNH